MEIKVEIKEEQEMEKIEYPLIYPLIGNADGLIVLFREARKGTVLEDKRKTNTPRSIGSYSASWNMANFKKIIGSITLSNE